MKKLIFSLLGCAAVLPFAACESDGDHRHERGIRTTTTTTEESTIQHPLQGTTETRSVRTY